METVGAFAAKTHFAALLERVALGERFTITRHGKPVAQLVPADDAPDGVAVDAAIEGLKQFAAQHTIDVDWKQLRDTGRKW
jgi:prevent-host-death family protein